MYITGLGLLCFWKLGIKLGNLLENAESLCPSLQAH